jgi:hypothetical protein
MEKIKASELYQKTEEINNFERYQKRVKDALKELEDVQTLIIHGLEDGRCFIGKASLECHEARECSSRIGEFARTHLANVGLKVQGIDTLNITINSYYAMVLLKAYEESIVRDILNIASDMNIEEDRAKTIFDDYIELSQGQVRRK